MVRIEKRFPGRAPPYKFDYRITESIELEGSGFQYIGKALAV
jgi:hypothetical protein